jgi:sugar lactone lactonase YvrE
MSNTAKTIVLASGFWRLKAPRWHSGDLWVSDPRAGKVYRIDLDGKVAVVAEVPNRPFGLGFLPDGGLLVASILCEEEHQRGDHNEYCGLDAARDQAGLE